MGDLASWLTAEPSALVGAALSSVATLALIIVFTRLSGLRSFAKLSAFDFATTVSIGSILATASLQKSAPLSVVAVALGSIYLVKVLIARLRQVHGVRFLDNEPLLLVRGQTILKAALRRAQMTEDDLRAKLREANVLDPGSVRAVIMETTGDVTVLHGDSELHPDLLRDVIDLSDRSTVECETSFESFDARETE